MNLKTARNLVVILTLIALGIAVYGVAAVPQDSPQYETLVWVSGGFLAAGILVLAIFSRCPHCGKLLFMGMLRMDHCPRCKKKLYVPVKGKVKGTRLK